MALGAAAPCALFLLGVTVALRPLGRVPAERAGARRHQARAASADRVWLLLSLVGDFGPLWTYAAVIMAALPPALNIFVISTQYDVGVERASACVLVGTVVSMVTLTAFLWLIKTGTMPADLFRLDRRSSRIRRGVPIRGRMPSRMASASQRPDPAERRGARRRAGSRPARRRSGASG